MPVLSLPSLPGLTCTNPNPTRHRIRTYRSLPLNLSIKLTAALNNNRCSPAGDLLRQLSVSSVLLMGLGLSSVWVSQPALARISSASPSFSAHSEETLGIMVFGLHAIIYAQYFVGKNWNFLSNGCMNVCKLRPCLGIHKYGNCLIVCALGFSLV